MTTSTTGFVRALKRSVATFVFAVAGALVGAPILDMDVAAWKPVVAAGLGAVVNLVYRWAESELGDAQRVDVVGGGDG